jgi:hypothetical protein
VFASSNSGFSWRDCNDDGGVMMGKKFRIPTREEINIVLCWGWLRLAIALPSLSLWFVREWLLIISELAHGCSRGIDKLGSLYSHLIIRPFDALMWEEYSTDTKVLDQASTIPTENIAHAIASYDGSVLLACRSGAGKSTTILDAIAEAQRLSDCDFWIFDGKGSAWGGLEKGSQYFLCNHYDLIEPAVAALNNLVSITMKSRQDARLANGGKHPKKPRRVVIILDEFNNIVTFAEMVKLQDNLCNLVTLLINMGREDLINSWLVAQTHLVGEINLSTGVQKSLAFVCQGRDTQYQSIEAALSDRNIISNPNERQRLAQQLESYQNQEKNQKIPICFTTIGGKRLVKLPAANEDERCIKVPSLDDVETVEIVAEPSLEEEFQEFQTSSTRTPTAPELALLVQILGAIGDGRSDDWIAKQIIPGSYYPAKQRAAEVRKLVTSGNFPLEN